MVVKIIILDNEHCVESEITICDAVRSIGLAPDSFIFMVNGKPVPMDTLIADGDTIKAIKVASGG